MSDTPRTDAFEQLVDRPINWWDFARELERENAALREDKERLDWLGNLITIDGWDPRKKRLVELTDPIRVSIDAARKEAQP